MNFISRRLFLSSSAAVLAIGGRPGYAQNVGGFRTITYNVLAFRGYPRNAKTRDELDLLAAEHPKLTAQALKRFSPNIVTLQEGPDESVTEQFAEELGMHHVWFPGGWEGNDEYPGGFPGVVASNYPIIESENRPSAGKPHDEVLFTRHLGRAVLEVPSGHLHVISVHFHASDHDVRMQEAAAVTALIQKLHSSGSVLLQGDLNHRPKAPEYATWKAAGLVDVGAKHGIGQTPTASSILPISRIDYIWATSELGEQSTHAKVLNTPPFVPKSGDSSSYALSDHLPVMADFM